MGIGVRWVFLLCLGMAWHGSLAEPADDTVNIRLGRLIAQDMPRYGLNLGGSGTWGAEHLRANLLANPGFEPVLDRTLLVIKEAANQAMVDDTPWLARPDGFWNGARFDIRSGMRAGLQGEVAQSLKRKDGLGELVTGIALNGVRTGDVVSVTHSRDRSIAPQWWRGRGQVTNTTETRPASPGQQAVCLVATPGNPAEILHYFDNISDRAGKLLLVNGKWNLSFWARSTGRGNRLHLYFGRAGSAVFLKTDVSPTLEWQHYSLDFDADDRGPVAPVTLSITATEGTIMLDDAYLGEAASGAGGFRKAVVDTLNTLKPGYLRDWQGQLGDTLQNRISGDDAHQPVRYRPGENEIQFHYGLADFFALCTAVGAKPWVVAPTTLSDAEWQQFGRYLNQAADQYGFGEIVVEFGNENWNTLFRPAGIGDPATHAAVVDRAFRLLRQGSKQDARIKTVVNAQYVNAYSPRTMAMLAKEADMVAVAPYLLNTLDGGLSDEQAHHAAFEESGQLLEQEFSAVNSRNKQLAVYEVNFHTTWGRAGAQQRNAVVTGAASGPALARRLMQATLAGVRVQNVYELSGFDSYASDNRDLVRLWGITHDLVAADHFRPTGLAVKLLNSAVGGAVHAAQCQGGACAELTVLAFAQGSRVAMVSARREPVTVQLQVPCQRGSVAMQWLDGSMAEKNNEQQANVKIETRELRCQGSRVVFTLPGHTLAVIG